MSFGSNAFKQYCSTQYSVVWFWSKGSSKLQSTVSRESSLQYTLLKIHLRGFVKLWVFYEYLCCYLKELESSFSMSTTKTSSQFSLEQFLYPPKSSSKTLPQSLLIYWLKASSKRQDDSKNSHKSPAKCSVNVAGVDYCEFPGNRKKTKKKRWKNKAAIYIVFLHLVGLNMQVYSYMQDPGLHVLKRSL